MGEGLYAGFVRAVVRLALPAGPALLIPDEPGARGDFPFDGPVHIVTAHNPGGVMVGDDANRERHRLLRRDLAAHSTVESIGSAPDGSMAEPGFAVLDIDLESALDVGRRFGQQAIYRWTPDLLRIVGVDDGIDLRLGWRLEARVPQ